MGCSSSKIARVDTYEEPPVYEIDIETTLAVENDSSKVDLNTKNKDSTLINEESKHPTAEMGIEDKESLYLDDIELDDITRMSLYKITCCYHP